MLKYRYRASEPLTFAATTESRMACALTNLPEYARERVARTLGPIPYQPIHEEDTEWLDLLLATTSIDLVVQMAIDEADHILRYLAVDHSHLLAIPLWPGGDGPVFGVEIDGDQRMFACVRTASGYCRSELGDGLTQVGELMLMVQMAVQMDDAGGSLR